LNNITNPEKTLTDISLDRGVKPLPIAYETPSEAEVFPIASPHHQTYSAAPT